MRASCAPAAVLAALLLLVKSAAPLSAADITLMGITFSDRYGGFNLLSVEGSGTRDDPFVIVEEVGGAGNAVLVIEGWHSHYVGGGHGGLSMTVRKVVLNATERTWNAFELELREKLDKPSGYLDGLSFGQPLGDSRTATSDRLPRVLHRDEPYDAIVFSGGDVAPGEQVTFDFIITDMTPVDRIFLIQRLRLDLVEAPNHEAAEAGRGPGG